MSMSQKFSFDLGELELRDFKVEDLEKVKILLTGTLSIRYPTKFYRQLVQGTDTKCILAFWKDILVGVLCFSCLYNELQSLDILLLVVSPVYQRLGIGSLLVNELKRKFPGMAFHLHVQISNENAIKFYQKHSFSIKETVKDYYFGMKEQRDAYLLQFDPSFA